MTTVATRLILMMFLMAVFFNMKESGSSACHHYVCMPLQHFTAAVLCHVVVSTPTAVSVRFVIASVSQVGSDVVFVCLLFVNCCGRYFFSFSLFLIFVSFCLVMTICGTASMIIRMIHIILRKVVNVVVFVAVLRGVSENDKFPDTFIQHVNLCFFSEGMCCCCCFSAQLLPPCRCRCRNNPKHCVVAMHCMQYTDRALSRERKPSRNRPEYYRQEEAERFSTHLSCEFFMSRAIVCPVLVVLFIKWLFPVCWPDTGK